MPRFFALVPAAGSGSRMGSELPKQYLPLCGRPLIEHTIRALAAHARIERVYVVLSPEDGRWEGHGIRHDKLSVLRCGGAARADSVLNGLKSIAGAISADDWVLVHDAARPCLRPEHLDRMLAELAEDEVGGILAVPVADTLKRAGDDRRIAATVPREGLWQAQTPQMFRHGLLLKALEAAGSAATDEASAIERMGLRPKLVEGDVRNLKVTYARDLELAALILEHWREQECR
ncbi:MAG: 2-C-methyl-D-erythritol 4-phosphate cytidylyltransferase [Pseudomonadota bacterium]